MSVRVLKMTANNQHARVIEKTYAVAGLALILGVFYNVGVFDPWVAGTQSYRPDLNEGNLRFQISHGLINLISLAILLPFYRTVLSLIK